MLTITFHIVPLPPEISSWMISWLQKINDLTESVKEQETKNIECGNDGVSNAESSITNTISSSKTYLQNSELDYSEPLLPPCADDNFPDRMKDLWLQAQWKRPWQNWVRSLGQTWGSTLHMTNQVEVYTQACQDNSKE